MAGSTSDLIQPGTRSIALVSPAATDDPVLHWLCRNLNAVPGIEAKVCAPDSLEKDHSRIPSWMAVNLSGRTEWDRTVFFCRDSEEAQACVDVAYALKTESAMFVDPTSDDDDFSNIAPRLSYTLEANVEVLPGASALKLFRAIPFALPAAPEPHAVPVGQRRKVTFFGLDEDDIQSVRGYLDNAYNPFDVQILTTGNIKTTLQKSGFSRPVFNLTECCPSYVLDRTDLLIDLSETVNGDLHAWILAYARASGLRVFSRCADREAIEALGLIPGSGTAHEFSVSLIGLLSGDPELRSMPPPVVCERCSAEGQRTLQGIIAAEDDEAPFLRSASEAKARSKSNVLMMPINGGGLGHAQRVTAFAGHLRNAHPDVEIAMATFPTCFEFVGSRGYTLLPLAARPLAQNDGAVEAVNLKRLLPHLDTSDVFVFDGGHPYDSVIGLLQSFGGRSIWVRRGLWRQFQDNTASHEREKYFSQVIRPLEAFEELNFSSRHSMVDEATVGPVVAEADGAAEVEAFLKTFRDAGNRIVVTMLGSGQAGKREHLTHFVCRALERYDDVANIVIRWPQDAGRAPLLDYRNATVIQSVWGTAFVDQADLVVSAAGYNTFHECMYYRKPALFIPQSVGWLDDQEARAEAAASRGAAIAINQDDVMGLRDALDSLLKENQLADIEAALKNLDLPSPGAATIAEMIWDGLDQTG